MKTILSILLLVPVLAVGQEGLLGGILQSELDVFYHRYNAYVHKTLTTDDPASIPLALRIATIFGTDFGDRLSPTDLRALLDVRKQRDDLWKSANGPIDDLVCDGQVRHVDEVDVYVLLEQEEVLEARSDAYHEQLYASLVKQLTPSGFAIVNAHVDAQAGTLVIERLDWAGITRDHPRAMAYTYLRNCQTELDFEPVCLYSDTEISRFDDEAEHAALRWRARDNPNYEFEYKMGGAWVAEEGRVVVNAGVADLPDDTDFERLFGRNKPMNKILASIQAYSADICRDIEYDPDLGFPRRVSTRASHPRTSDSDFSMSISNLITY